MKRNNLLVILLRYYLRIEQIVAYDFHSGLLDQPVTYYISHIWYNNVSKLTSTFTVLPTSSVKVLKQHVWTTTPLLIELEYLSSIVVSLVSNLLHFPSTKLQYSFETTQKALYHLLNIMHRKFSLASSSSCSLRTVLTSLLILATNSWYQSIMTSNLYINLAKSDTISELKASIEIVSLSNDIGSHLIKYSFFLSIIDTLVFALYFFCTFFLLLYFLLQ